MSRPASPLTLAIWALCEQNPEITHAQAQPLLAKQGFEVTTKQEMSDDLKLWREQGKLANLNEKGHYINCRIKDEKFLYDKDAFDRLALACGMSRARSQKVLQEIMLDISFKAETNNFNVTVYNWRQRQNKPTTAKTTTAKTKTTTAKPKRTAKKSATVTAATTSVRPKHAPKHAPKSTRSKSVQPQTVVLATSGNFTPTEALEYVAKHGGMGGVNAAVSQIDKELVALESQMSKLRSERELHSNAVATLAEFQKAMREAA